MRQAVPVGRCQHGADSLLFPKKTFRTSFGVDVEYLVIPKHSEKFDPKSPTLLFFNGYMLRLSQWGFQMPRHTQAAKISGFSDYNMVFFNNLGHGKSGITGTSEQYLRLCAQAAHELIKELKAGTIFTVAHSMGSPISLEFHRLTSSQVEAMAFISPVLSNPLDVFPYGSLVEPRLGDIQAVLRREMLASALTGTLKFLASDFFMVFWHKYFVHKTGSGIPSDAFAKILQKSLELDVGVFVTAFLSMVQTGQKLGDHFGDVHLPKKIILGKKDFFTDPGKTKVRIAELDPSSRVVVLPDTTHWANSEKPRRVNQELARFFASV